jgi:hypothetical protein
MTSCKLAAAFVSLTVLAVAGAAAVQLFSSTPVEHPAPGGLTRHIEMKIQLPGVFRFRLSAENESDFSIGNATVAAEEEQ